VAFSPVARSARPAWTDPEAVGSAALILLAVFFAYLPALHGGFLWDDDAHVTRLALRSLRGLGRIWFEVGATQQYYPVLHSAFWLEHRLWGDAVAGYHLANVGLHATAAWLLVLILRRVSFPFPVLAGLLFALHPVCVESVAWISEQKNTLSAVFYLWAAFIYLGFDGSRRKAGYAAALALFFLALLTKSVTATLPAALLLVLWWRRGRLEWRRDVTPLGPWFLVAAASSLFTAWDERNLIGAEGADFSFTALQRLLLAGRAITFYAGKVIWPHPLVFIYPRELVNTREAGPYLLLSGVVAVLAALALYSRRNRGPLAGALFFAGTLFPVLGFVNVYPFLYSFVADHFQYLASIGLIVPLAWVLNRLASRSLLGSRGRACLLLAFPALLGCLSWRQCRMYSDAETLYRATLADNPSAWLAHYNLAVILGDRAGGLAESVSEYQATLKLRPEHWAAHSNLGSAYLKLPGRTGDAVREYRAALELNPKFADAHSNLGIALGRDPARQAEAVAEVRTALELRPNDDGILNNLGSLLVRQPGSLGEAVGAYEAAIRLAPDNPEYHYNLANALARSPGRLPEAVREYGTALRLKPGYLEAHSNLGAALFRTPGGKPAAAEEFAAALKIDPANPGLHQEYGVVLADLPGRLPEAIAEFEAAIRARPDFVQAHYSLGWALLRAPGRREEAIEQLRLALAIDPGFGPALRALKQAETPQ
jgi:tetratricopeptide (TPR) repeat protein